MSAGLFAVPTPLPGGTAVSGGSANHGADRGADRGLVVGSLCTGYGGLDLGVLAALGGGRLAWVADPDPAVGRILAARFPGVPNLGDIRAVDWAAAAFDDDADGDPARHAVEPVDVLTAGFPCQDISFAGRGAGITEGNRSGLWYSVADAVRGLRPALVVVENVAALRSKRGGLGVVLGGLAALGYDTRWRSVRASDIGAAHRRDRVFLLAYPTGTRFVRAAADTTVADPAGPRLAHPDADRAATDQPGGDQPGGEQPAGHGGPAAADPGRPGRARRPAPGAAAGPWPAGQPAGRGHRTPGGTPRDTGDVTGDVTGRDDGKDDGAVAADSGGGQPQRRREPGPVAGPAGTAPGPEDQRQRDGHAVGGRGPAAAHPARGGGHARQPEPAQLLRAAGADRHGAAAAADPTRVGQPQQPDSGADAPLRSRARAGGRTQPGDPAGRAGRSGWQRAAELADRPTAAELTGGGADQSDESGDGSGNQSDNEFGGVDWGEYAAAVRRWSSVLGRTAPYPTEPGRTGRPRLAAAFVEWLMGLPEGWVTGVAVSRAAQLRALGNGVVPAQAATAVSLLLRDSLTDDDLTDDFLADDFLADPETHLDDNNPDRQAGKAAAA